MKKQKGKSTILWILAIVVVIAVAVVIFLLIRNGKVSIGSQSVNRNTEELTLSSGEYDPEMLIAALPKLPKLSKLSFPDTDLTAEELERIRNAAEGVDVTFTVDINGQTCDQGTQSLDLSGLSSDLMSEITPKLSLLPSLSQV